MKKSFLSTLILSSLTVFSVSALAEDLTTVYRLATQKDPQLLRAEAVRNAARERIDVSKARLLPQVNLTAGYSKSMRESQAFIGDDLVNLEIESTGWNAQVGLSQSIFDWTNWKNLNTAEKLAMQSQTILDAEIQALIVRVSQAYFNVLEAVLL